MTDKYSKVIAKMESIMNQYNPEFDVVPGGPMVTATELKLVEMIGILSEEIRDLRKEIESNKIAWLF